MSATVRKATKEDCQQIVQLVQELADYEKMPQCMKLTADDYIKDGFGEHPFYHCHVAEMASGKICGFVLYYWTFSTWEGRSVYMEDIYVSQEFRGKGIGKALWKACVQAALDIGCSRCNFSVLDWNKPAIDFYKLNGATDLSEKEGWLSFRMNQSQMKKFCSQ